jgi:predicted neutral ceramidase superfamily lipid hydrolase
VCVFRFNGRKFCIIYFDANNILPAFREKLLHHIERKFRMSAEVCTTDTHSINTISHSASNSLGRYTNVNEVIPIIDGMVKSALHESEPVSYAYKKLKVENFPVWGEKADMLIERTSREVRRMLEYGTPIFVALAFVVAAWVIYVV